MSALSGASQRSLAGGLRARHLARSQTSPRVALSAITTYRALGAPFKFCFLITEYVPVSEKCS